MCMMTGEGLMATVAELEIVFSHLVEAQAPAIDSLPEGADSMGWLLTQDFAMARVSPTGNVIGLAKAGLPGLLAFAKAVRAMNPRYARGTRIKPFVEQVFSQVVAVRRGRSAGPIQPFDIAAIEKGVAAWFASEAQVQKHLIPCAILPDLAKPFSIGPVHFQPVSTFDPASFDIMQGLEQVALAPLDALIRQRGADWLAAVEVDGYEPERSNEVAELAVDVALGSLQLVIPLTYGARASRITARMLPPFTAALVNVAGKVSPRTSNNQPGLGLGGSAFDAFLNHGDGILASAGQRIRSFITGRGILPKLEMAWCNGAFWFHEALAEPLATVAIAKLETAIENLFGSSSLGESKKRILMAFRGLYGLERGDPIAVGSSIQVDTYVEKVVEVRSRILHGNWSTLTEELPLGREEVANLARCMLVDYNQQLDLYSATSNPVDEAVQFLDWIVMRRRAATSQNTSNAASPSDQIASGDGLECSASQLAKTQQPCGVTPTENGLPT
ncbi:MAG: hypothetical protein B7W99_01630 [Rhodospirillales bacterium 20-58-10]|nr:MAG: hypothetical protein B7W99_01630 [Rhodospirillales bacterium 20-58-10]